MGVDLRHVLGVDARAVAVLDLPVAHLDGADHRGEVEVQVDPGEEVEALGGRHVGHHGPAGADAHLEVGGGHGDELGLVGRGAAGDGPADGLLAEERPVSPGQHRGDERLVVLVGHDGEGAPVGVDEGASRASRPSGRRRPRAGAPAASATAAAPWSDAVAGAGVVRQEAREHRGLGLRRRSTAWLQGSSCALQGLGHRLACARLGVGGPWRRLPRARVGCRTVCAAPLRGRRDWSDRSVVCITRARRGGRFM